MLSQVPPEIRREISSYLPGRSLGQLARTGRELSILRPTFEQCCDIISLRDLAYTTWNSLNLERIEDIIETTTPSDARVWIYHIGRDIGNAEIITSSRDLEILFEEDPPILSSIIAGTLLDFIIPFLRKRQNCPEGFVEQCWLLNLKHYVSIVEGNEDILIGSLYDWSARSGRDKIKRIIQQLDPNLWDRKNPIKSIQAALENFPTGIDLIVNEFTVDDIRPDFFTRSFD